MAISGLLAFALTALGARPKEPEPKPPERLALKLVAEAGELRAENMRLRSEIHALRSTIEAERGYRSEVMMQAQQAMRPVPDRKPAPGEALPYQGPSPFEIEMVERVRIMHSRLGEFCNCVPARHDLFVQR